MGGMAGFLGVDRFRAAVRFRTVLARVRRTALRFFGAFFRLAAGLLRPLTVFFFAARLRFRATLCPPSIWKYDPRFTVAFQRRVSEVLPGYFFSPNAAYWSGM